MKEYARAPSRAGSATKNAFFELVSVFLPAPISPTNTIVRRGGELHATNTDVVGVLRALEDADVEDEPLPHEVAIMA